ncbi:putative metalloprotease CJM1_0395 family protein [Paraglaciecola aquimarina]|uniref:Metalloprotease CJM1_0395 family protein n=1 Tax=Paraglaciecola aquimarina TaxID=1235557 RepID=A0ABU3STC8_9ALTE|nr:putative metalloprotease CJM1_0395 family protein [Paraglaciecola aquimarina]MDU0353244.1 putative metalloprotease CJM1_0395 family protein [Paraglaciecola aquimarina]
MVLSLIKSKLYDKNNQAVTYEKPSNQSGQQQITAQGEQAKDNAEDESAGKESAEQRQQEQQSNAEQEQIRELKQRDLEVRAHEQAHASTGGQYSGSPQYEFTKGPDGKNYATSGEVSIDVSKASTPEETIRKAQQVKAAALAPLEPSPQDLRVANEATQMATEARVEIAAEKAEQAQEALTAATTYAPSLKESQSSQLDLDLEDIVEEIDITAAPRTLAADNAEIADDTADSQVKQDRDLEINRRVSVIKDFYQNVSQPHEVNLKLSA